MAKQAITGETLYTIKELSQMSQTPVKTLKEWFQAGDLKMFLTIYEDKRGHRYYRWGAPYHWEHPKTEGGFIYDLEMAVNPQ